MDTSTLTRNVNRLSEKMAKADQEMSLIEMVEESIQMSTFHFKARKFVETLCRQREIIIDRHKSQKNPHQMLKTIDHLRVNLDAASSKDRPMARYFLLYEEEIRSLIPGKYPSKYYNRFIELRDQARDINNRQLSMS